MAGPRNKYLVAQEEQQRLEKLHAAQAEFMRLTLFHLSAAAQGLDENLDRELVLLKEKIRGAGGAEVVEQMERVQAAVKQFERSRDQQTISAVSQFTSLVEHLLELRLPADLRKQLQNYQKTLKSRLDSWRIYPELIAELAAIQKLALEAATREPQNLWQRLQGGKALASAHSPEIKPENIEAAPAQESTSSAPETVKRELRHDFELPQAEDDYQQVAKRITRTLNNLVASIDSNELIRHKLEIVRGRLQRGMDWFALAVTLEDIRDILMQRYLAADKEFSDYLKKVNDDLHSIREKLGLAAEARSNHSTAVTALSDAVSQHVSKMHHSLNKDQGLQQLKQEVSLHINEIQRALENFHKKESDVDSLGEQLRDLLAHVQSVENESQKTKVMLEQERYKATHDALTSLPNREAYAERVWQEYQRYKRYQHPLTLAVCDIDYFKKINDNYGHQAGDKVLKLFAKLLSTRLREVDFVGRYGGEEFVILLPETSADQALGVLDKIRAAVSTTPFRFRNEPVQISASFGIAAFQEQDQVETVFARADKALYEAKRKGRNCCVVA